MIFEDRKEFGLESNSSKKIMDIPDELDITTVYFLDLRLEDSGSGEEVEQNFYWLSTKKDIPDFPKTEWFYTPIKQYADFRDLMQIPVTTLTSDYRISNGDGEQVMEVLITNSGTNIAFFIELQLIGEKSREVVLPVFWEDNYISLQPGESRTLKVRYSTANLQKDHAALVVSGWNVK
jgi:exo-1,4-beta-D-glucosaminidase